MSIDLRKSLIYVLSVCAVMGLLVCVWATDGCRNFAAWNSKPVMPFVWGILLFVGIFGLLLFTRPLAMPLQSRTMWQLWARGIICGIMISVIWATFYLGNLLLKSVDLKLGVYVGIIGFIAALGLGAIGIRSDNFLERNLVDLGWLTVIAGGVIFAGTHTSLGELIGATGLATVLVVTVITGRIITYRPQHSGGRREILREDSPVEFWLVASVIAVALGIVVFDLICRVFGFAVWHFASMK